MTFQSYPVLLTYERHVASGAWQQVVHHEQEDGVAQDEGHLEGGAVHTLGRKQGQEDRTPTSSHMKSTMPHPMVSLVTLPSILITLT